MLNWIIPTHKNGFRAYALRTEALVVITLVLFIFNSFAGAIDTAAAFSVSSEDLLAAHNQLRQQSGLPQLQLNPALINSAQSKARAMLQSDCWSHYCPAGKSPWDFFAEAGYNYNFAGENLAEGFSDLDSMMAAWMASPTHKDNIMRAEFTQVGFGIITGTYQGIKGNLLIVAHFGTPQQPNWEAFPLPTSSLSLPQPSILQPQNLSVLPTSSVEILGKASEAEAVKLYTGSDVWQEIPVNAGAFSSTTTYLADGVYELTAIAFAEGKQSIPSDLVTFWVDTTPDILDASAFSVISSSKEWLLVQLNAPQLAEVKLNLKEGKVVNFTQATANVWQGTLPLSDIQDEGILKATTKDLAGNIWEGEIYVSPILDQLPDSNNSVISKSMVNVGLGLFLGILYLLDLALLKSTGATRTHRPRFHLHLGLILVIMLVAITGGAGGEIQAGINTFYTQQ